MNDHIQINKEFAESLLAEFYSESFDFKPFHSYDRKRDCIEFFAKNDSFYHVHVDDGIVLYLSNDTDEFVGFKVLRFSELVKSATQVLSGVVNQNKVRLQYIITMKATQIEKATRTHERASLRRMIDCAENEEVDMGELVGA